MDLKSYLRKYSPKKNTVKQHKHLHYFSDWLNDPALWKWTARSSSNGVAIGLFWGMMPIPMQTVLATLTSIILKVNLPLSIMFVWVTNPVTAAPIYYLAYKLGSILLQEPIRELPFDLSISWMTETFTVIWQPLLVGCLLLGVCLATIGNLTIILIWKIFSLKRWWRWKS